MAEERVGVDGAGDEGAEEKVISLVDGRIVHWNDERGLAVYGAVCEIKRRLGVSEGFKGDFGNFTIHASAAKYLVDLARWDGETHYPEEKFPVEEEILFDGTLTVYKDMEFRQHGMIWTARKPYERATERNVLEDLIFGDSKDKHAVIEAIVRGYDKRDRDRKTAQLKAVNDAVQDALGDVPHSVRDSYGI